MTEPEKETLREWVMQLAEINVSADHGNSQTLRLSKAERKARREAQKSKKQADRTERTERKRPRVSQPGEDGRAVAKSLSDLRPRTIHRNHPLILAMKSFASDGQVAYRQRLFVGDSASHHRKRRWDEVGIQPRSRDYGGIGLARPSLFLSFDDPSWLPKLEQEFAEHVPGFFGKQRTKAMKKQLNANMLWKRLLNEKQQQNNPRKRKKLNHVTKASTDDRVEALLRTGADL